MFGQVLAGRGDAKMLKSAAKLVATGSVVGAAFAAVFVYAVP